jgi:hypothetical protein
MPHPNNSFAYPTVERARPNLLGFEALLAVAGSASSHHSPIMQDCIRLLARAVQPHGLREVISVH